MQGDVRKRYLRLKGNVWQVKFPIPRKLRSLYPTGNGTEQTHRERSLRTGDLDEAHCLKFAAIAEFRAEFTQRAKEKATQAKTKGLPVPDYIRDALEWRASRAEDEDDEEGADLHATDVAEQIAAKHGIDAGRTFVKLATRREATLREGWAVWTKENTHNPATKLKDEQALSRFLAFLKVHDVFPSEVTSQVGRDYVRHLKSEARSARGGRLSTATQRDRIAPLRIFWNEYLQHNELVPHGVNPWTGHKFAQKKGAGEQPDKKRPYTDAEIIALCHGPELPAKGGVRYSKRTLMELYALTFYTGVRIEELCGRDVSDFEKIKGGYTMHIRYGKNDAAERTIVILHSIPVALIKQRIGSRAKGQLFAEFIPGGPNGSLAWYPSKALGRYRDKVGQGTALDTHGTRRTFITRMIAKGLPERLVQFYVGHTPPGVTAGVYAKSTEEGMRMIAKEVKYPSNVEAAMRKALGL
jgi:integrase